MFHDEVEGVGLHKLGYYGGSDPGAVGAGMAWIDTSGGTGNYQIKIRNAGDTDWEVLEANPLTHTHTEVEITDLGDYLDETAADLLYAALAHTHLEADVTDLDKYTQAEVDALFVPLDGSKVPHYNKGTGSFHAVCTHGVSVNLVSSAAIVTAFDLIRTLKGGVASPTYTYFMKKLGGSYGAGNSDPQAESVTYTPGEAGINQIIMKVSDGTSTTVDIAMYVTVQ